MNFNEALPEGKAQEKRILNQVRKKYPLAIIIDGKFKDYDIWIPETHESIEVKRDYKSSETGNFLIEVEMNGVVSGLCASKADWWVLISTTEDVWIKRVHLKDYILRNNYQLREFIGNGDSVKKKAYLINKSKLIKVIKNEIPSMSEKHLQWGYVSPTNSTI